MLTVPLLGLFLFGALAIGEKRDAADEAAGIADLTEMSSAAAAFLHESQLERGVTSLFLNGADNAAEVKAERRATDVALAKLRAQAEDTRDDQDGAVGTRIRGLLKAAAGLPALRRGIDAGTVPPGEVIARYTAMNTLALETVGDIARRANDPSLGAQLDAYAAYLGAKESSGVERATLAGGLRAGAWPDAPTLRGFVSAVALRDARLRTFELSATPADRAFAQRTVSGEQVRRAEQIETRALATLTADRLTAGAPKTWFAAQTERINLMKRVEDHLSAGVIDSASAIRDDATRAMRTYMLIMAFAVFAAIGIAVAISVQLRRAVIRVLERLRGLSERDVPSIAEGIGAMADGDLTRRAEVAAETIDRPGRDEIGRIGSAVNDIAGRTAEMADAYNASRATLAGMLAEVSDTAQTVSSASQQMAASSQETGTATDEIAHAITEMAHGAERQVQMVEAARRTADEVVESTNVSSDRAKETAARASEARTVAAEGSEAVARVTDAMRGVRESSQEATEAIRGLGAKSVEIGGIIETIRAIAEQTNLLALNAAIEAARAGEQGRGFAVVAEEVRKLAEESQDAARSIGDLVSEIQRETSTAVTVVEAGAERSEESGRIVDDARRSFDRIGEAVDGVSTQVGDIVEAAERIARAAEDMRSSMEEIAAVSEQASASTQQVSASTQETSATTQEIAQTAGSLASTAGHLEELAARFRVA